MRVQKIEKIFLTIDEECTLNGIKDKLENLNIQNEEIESICSNLVDAIDNFLEVCEED